MAQPLSLILPEPPRPERPVLVIGCPRSGTTILRQALAVSDELRSIQVEGHVLWNAFHHPSDRGWDSDALAADDVTERERAYVHWAIRLFVRGRRFLDKTPENSLRVPYLDALFPDATFVFLHRRGAENVNSLIEGWRARPRFVTYRLPEPLEGLGPLSGPTWSFVLVPGWRELRRAPLEEICARQYVACNEALLDARGGIERGRWVEIAYDDLVASPVEELRRVYGAAGLRFTPAAEAFAANLDRTTARTALTPPKPEKWREQNEEAVERILPLVAETERKLGYAA